MKGLYTRVALWLWAPVLERIAKERRVDADAANFAASQCIVDAGEFARAAKAEADRSAAVLGQSLRVQAFCAGLRQAAPLPYRPSSSS